MTGTCRSFVDEGFRPGGPTGGSRTLVFLSLEVVTCEVEIGSVSSSVSSVCGLLTVPDSDNAFGCSRFAGSAIESDDGAHGEESLLVRVFRMSAPARGAEDEAAPLAYC